MPLNHQQKPCVSLRSGLRMSNLGLFFCFSLVAFLSAQWLTLDCSWLPNFSWHPSFPHLPAQLIKEDLALRRFRNGPLYKEISMPWTKFLQHFLLVRAASSFEFQFPQYFHRIQRLLPWSMFVPFVPALRAMHKRRCFPSLRCQLSSDSHPYYSFSLWAPWDLSVVGALSILLVFVCVIFHFQQLWPLVVRLHAECCLVRLTWCC